MAGKSSTYVLDSFALLAYLEGEAGMPRVRTLLTEARSGAHTLYLSLINLGETLYITERERGLTRAQQVLSAVEQLPIQIVPVSRAVVLAAAHIKALYPISYADAFSVVTAHDCDGVVLTGDPEFKLVSHLVNVEWLPRR